MDKIKITSFKDNIASAILNSQSTNKNLNFHADGYIDAEELPGVLEFFGETDVNKLLKQNSSDNSVFTSEEGTETSKPEAQKTGNLTPEDCKKFSELIGTNNATLHDEGSAAYELQDNIASDLATEYSGTPYAAQMQSLFEEKKALLKNRSTEDAVDAIDAKIEALNQAAQQYIELNQSEAIKNLTDNDLVKSFKYGKDGEKTGYYVQTLKVKGNKTSGGSDDNQDNNGEGTENNTQSNNNAAVGGVIYNVEVITDRLHAIGHVDADTENSDIAAVAVYNTPLKNGGRLDVSGNFRQTIEKDNNETRFGASLSYTGTNFSTGAYGSYKAGERDDEKTNSLDLEAYGKYKKTFRGAVGYSRENTGYYSSSVKYASAKLYGRREIPNKNLTLTGSIEGTVGVTDIAYDNQREVAPMQKVTAKGGLAFKSSHSDFATNILGSVTYGREKNEASGYDSTVTSTLLGNVSTKKVDVTATLTAANYPVYKRAEEGGTDLVQDGRNTSWSSSITLGLKKVLGKNVTPSVTYNINSDEEVKHNVLFNLGVNF